jgi:hypothetical protein
MVFVDGVRINHHKVLPFHQAYNKIDVILSFFSLCMYVCVCGGGLRGML